MKVIDEHQVTAGDVYLTIEQGAAIWGDSDA